MWVEFIYHLTCKKDASVSNASEYPYTWIIGKGWVAGQLQLLNAPLRASDHGNNRTITSVSFPEEHKSSMYSYFIDNS